MKYHAPILIMEPYTAMRIRTRFPHIPTNQPQCVEELNELQKQQWLDFSKSVLEIIDKKNKIGIAQIVVIAVLIIIVICLLGLIAYFMYRYASGKGNSRSKIK